MFLKGKDTFHSAERIGFDPLPSIHMETGIECMKSAWAVIWSPFCIYGMWTRDRKGKCPHARLPLTPISSCAFIIYMWMPTSDDYDIIFHGHLWNKWEKLLEIMAIFCVFVVIQFCLHYSCHLASPGLKKRSKIHFVFVMNSCVNIANMTTAFSYNSLIA